MSSDDAFEEEAGALTQLRERLRAESNDGLQLAKNPLENPICSIAFEASVPCVTIVWKRYATSTQLRFVHESILDLVRRSGVVKILGDDTAMPIIHGEDQTWIVESWMPRAVAAGVQVVANKAPSSQFGKIDVASVQSAASAYLVARSFSDLDEAREWLSDYPVSRGPNPLPDTKGA